MTRWPTSSPSTKNLEQKEAMVDEVRGAEDAKKVIQKCLDQYIEKFCR
ncbi:MAG: hypothetical protein ACLUE8_17705 [Lachnospiraceae bacterium]